jgi:2-polyprenyl-3-methyl-5-hydroxy-6-metoxy-1,4-benzoquinol methylase
MLDVLDYGCGCGGFCKVLNSKGFKTTGIDLSSKMIHTAIKNPPKEVEYLIGDLNLLKDIKGKFNAILATMVMQFIENPESYILALNKILSINGIFVMSVFNPVFVKECIKLNKAFVNENKINIGSVLLNTYTRTAKDYKSMLVNNGFKFLSSYYPKFNKAFVQKYKWALPSDISEYLVMVFKKEI